MDTIGGFFQQPFVGALFAMMCFFGLLLLGVVGWMVRSRKLRTADTTPRTVASTTADNGADLPALDMLLDTSSLLAETPARKQRTGTFTLKLAEGGTVDAVEVMAVLRDVVNGNLIIQINDKAYRNGTEIGDTEFRDRLVKVLRELSAQTAKAPEAPVLAEVPLPPIVDSAPKPPVEPTPKPKLNNTLPPPAPTKAGALPGDLPKFSLDDQPAPTLPPGLLRGVLGGKKASSNPIPELNIAGAIEAYLQHKLQSTPEYAGRSIHVHPSPDGGVSIEVDGNYYDAVSDVADAEVREFIATAIQEWQERH